MQVKTSIDRRQQWDTPPTHPYWRMHAYGAKFIVLVARAAVLLGVVWLVQQV
jgi:hypothetical protein